MALIPSTILTGFLGAGKTTLLNRILQEDHGLRIAVIENEFGQENIDNEILVQDSTEQIVEMNNGCICCTVRGDLIVALTRLAQKRDAGEIQFDRVVIETTGLANPGPVAQTFFVDEEVGAHYMLDAVVTVVDARHAMAQLDEHEEAQRQVGFADKILISKSRPGRRRPAGRAEDPPQAHQPARADQPLRLRPRPAGRGARHPRLQPERQARTRPATS